MHLFWWLIGLACLHQAAAAIEGHLSCPSGFILFEQNGFDACIHLSKQPFNRSAANIYCHKMQGSLIRIDSLERSAQLASSLVADQSIEVWIQGNSLVIEKEKTQSGVSNTGIAYSGHTEPANNISDHTPCAVAFETTWKSDACYHSHPVVCFAEPKYEKGMMILDR